MHAIAVIPTAPIADWGWPEARLRYANATLPHALIAAGDALGDGAAAVADGLEMLATLLDLETDGFGRLSVTGSADAGRMQSARSGISRPSRRPRSPMRVLRRTGSPAIRPGWPGSTAPGTGSSAPTTRVRRSTTPSPSWIPRTRTRRPQRQPRCGVHPRGPRHPAARAGRERRSPVNLDLQDAGVWLEPDPARLVASLFLPGESTPGSTSRTANVTERVLRMSPANALAAAARRLLDDGRRHPGSGGAVPHERGAGDVGCCG